MCVCAYVHMHACASWRRKSVNVGLCHARWAIRRWLCWLTCQQELLQTKMQLWFAGTEIRNNSKNGIHSYVCFGQTWDEYLSRWICNICSFQRYFGCSLYKKDKEIDEIPVDKGAEMHFAWFVFLLEIFLNEKQKASLGLLGGHFNSITCHIYTL